MEIQQLRAWRSVVATGSVRGAAQALGYSPSAISQQISLLQRSTELTLFVRSGRGLEATEEGIALAGQIDRVLAELGSLEEFVRSLRAGQRSGLTIGYFASMGPTWMPEILTEISSRFPDVRLELFLSDSHQPNRVPRPDMQLVILPEGADAPAGHEIHRLMEDPYVAAVPASHVLAEQSEVTLAELAEYDWIDNDVPGGLCRDQVITACAAAGFQPVFRIQATDLSSALALVAQDVGISVVPAIIKSALPEDVVTLPIRGPRPTRTIYALLPTGATNRPVVLTALELAKSIGRRTAD